MSTNFLKPQPREKTTIVSVASLVCACALTIAIPWLTPKTQPRDLKPKIKNNIKKIDAQEIEIGRLKKISQLEHRAYQQQTDLINNLTTITNHLPNNTRLQQLTLSHHQVEIYGLSRSETDINHYLAALKKNTNLSHIVLDKIALSTKHQLISFKLSQPHVEQYNEE